MDILCQKRRRSVHGCCALPHFLAAELQNRGAWAQWVWSGCPTSSASSHLIGRSHIASSPEGPSLERLVHVVCLTHARVACLSMPRAHCTVHVGFSLAIFCGYTMGGGGGRGHPLNGRCARGCRQVRTIVKPVASPLICPCVACVGHSGSHPGTQQSINCFTVTRNICIFGMLLLSDGLHPV